jgi:hypothetical protein
MPRRDDPSYGGDEVVPSWFNPLTRRRHYMMDTSEGWLQVCQYGSRRIERRPANEIWPVRAREITCNQCRKHLNV